MTDLPPEYAAAMANLTDHRIEGIAIQGMTPFACPLISHVEGNLWQGGTPADAPGSTVPAFFKYVVSLYPHQYYHVPEGTTLIVHKMQDHAGMPEIPALFQTARLVNQFRAEAPTLVHCQAGLNRSALVTALALILEGRTPDDAIRLLREKRSPAVLCNATFERWLREQENGDPAAAVRV